jgi:flagellar hook assembly protein FlgD
LQGDPYWDDDAEWTAAAKDVPQATELLGNYQTIQSINQYQVCAKRGCHVTLRVYNMLGQVVATLVDEAQTSGYKSVAWNGRNESGAGVASGIYIYRITAGTFTAPRGCCS